MDDFIRRYQNILIIIGLVVAAFVAYSLFFTGTPRDALTTENIDPTSSAVEQELIGLLLQLRSIELDVSFFSDTRFRSLEDFGQDVVNEPVGRTNPFAPLGQ